MGVAYCTSVQVNTNNENADNGNAENENGVQCSYGSVTMDYVPNGVWGDNFQNFNKPVSAGSQETCNFLVHCQPDGPTVPTDCWSTCAVTNGWSVDPAIWNWMIAVQEDDAY